MKFPNVITRSTALSLAGELQIPSVTRSVALTELSTCDEAFATSTAGGIMPITRVDDRAIGDGKMGPVTHRLVQLYWEKHQDPDWSTAAFDLTQ